MSDLGDNITGKRVSRPTLTQLKTIMEFMDKHPDLAHRKLRYGVRHHKFKKLWIELSNMLNSMGGAMKTTKGWIKFWSDKRRSVIYKQQQIEEGKLQGKISALEQKIIDLGETKIFTRKKRKFKASLNGDDNEEDDDALDQDEDELENLFTGESYDKQLGIMEQLVEAMGQQAVAMSQMAQANMSSSKSLHRFAEASNIQALAVDRIATTFENSICSSVQDIKNALLGIDYTMKRYYPGVAAQRQNSNIFS